MKNRLTFTKTTTDAHSLKGAFLSTDKPIASSYASSLYTSLEQIKSINANDTMDKYTKSQLLSKHLKRSNDTLSEELNRHLSVLGGLKNKQESKLFSADTKLSYQQQVILPQVLVLYKDNKIELSNTSVAKQVIELSNMGLLDTANIQLINEHHSPDAVKALQGIESETKAIMSAERDYLAEVSSVASDGLNFTAVGE